MVGIYLAKRSKTMKKLLIISILSLFLYNVIHAQKITEQQALEKANAFMKGKMFSNKERSLRRAMAYSAEDINDAFYIFNAEDNNGFVIVSGDERTEDILGYSETGSIDLNNLPQNMQSWLEGYRSEIQNLGNKSIQKIRRSAKSAVAPLIQTKWSQGHPYSNLCPLTNGYQCPTGCTATAMAQVLYYYKWPQIETAEIPEYTGSCSKIFCPALPPTIFDWDNMRLEYNITNGVPDYSQEEADAVAKLMRYCGQAVHMDYQLGGSSGRVDAKTLVYNFWYGWNARYARRKFYSSSEWENLIYKEVSEGRPVLYMGYPHTGHEFICDGYDGNGLYHINWGAAGNYDGYFALSILDTNYEGTNGGYSSDGYSMTHEAVIGIEPDYNEDLNKRIIDMVWHGAYRGRSSVDKDFWITIDTFEAKYALNHSAFVGEIGLAVFKEEMLCDIILPGENKEPYPNHKKDASFYFGANWTENHTLKLFYKTDGDDEWKDAHLVSWEYNPNDVNKITCKQWNWDAREYRDLKTDMSINSITFDNRLIAGVKNFATINVTNTGESYELPMYIDIDGEGVAACSAWLSPQETGEVRISFTPGSAGEKTLDIHGIRTLHHNSDGTWEDVTRHYYSKMITIYENSTDNQIAVSEVSANKGKTATLAIELNNKTTTLSAYQFDLKLPTGFTLSKNDKGKFQVSKTNRYEDESQTLNVSAVEGSSNIYRFVCFSMSNSVIEGTNGAILNAIIDADNTVEPGSYEGQISDIVFTKADGTQLILNSVKFNIVVNNVTKGDVNDDSEINVSDIVEIVNYIMGKPSAKFVEAAADLNEDGEVNVTDIVKIVSIIMSSNSSRQRASVVESTDNDRLALAENEKNALSLCLNNESGYVASQFDVHLSEGQTLEGIMLNSIRSKDHVLTYTKTNNDTYRIVVYSLGNQAYTGNNGELLSIQVSGTGNVDIDNILFVTTGQNEKRFASLHSYTTGINVVKDIKDMDVYSIDGRLVRKRVSNTNDLKKGVYIVNGKKLVVR
jgi:hypothetical protein